MFSNALFEKTYALCQKWHLRQFSFREKARDFLDELFELAHSIIMRKPRREVGLEYGDLIFTLVRHARGEKRRFCRRYILYIVPGKKWLERKLEIFEKRHTWWLKNHHFHSIRNNKNPQKVQKILDRQRGVIPRNTWIK